MTEPWSDEHLEAVLSSVGDHLVVPDHPNDGEGEPAPTHDGELAPEIAVRTELSGASSPGLSLPRRLKALKVAAAVLVAVAIVGTAVAPVREAVADWLGLGSTRIERVDPDDPRGEPAGLPAFETDLVPASPVDVAAQLGALPPPDYSRTDLGPPELLAVPPEGGVVALWAEGSTSLWFYPVDPADPASRVMEKYADHSDRVVPVVNLGEGALALEGDHVLSTPDRRVAADNVVLWIDGGLELRLESDLDIETLIAVARAIG